MLGANSELNFWSNKLDQAWSVVKDIEKIIELSIAMKKAAREDYEAKILEPRKTVKECKEHLTHEQLEREKIYQRFLHEQFQLGKACEQIKNLKKGIYDQAYLDLQNNRRHWEEIWLGTEATMVQMDAIIKNLQTHYK